MAQSISRGLTAVPAGPPLVFLIDGLIAAATQSEIKMVRTATVGTFNVANAANEIVVEFATLELLG